MQVATSPMTASKPRPRQDNSVLLKPMHEPTSGMSKVAISPITGLPRTEQSFAPQEKKVEVQLHKEIGKEFAKARAPNTSAEERNFIIKKVLQTIATRAGKNIEPWDLIKKLQKSGKISRQGIDELNRLNEVLDEVKGVQELELLNRKRVKHFNKILTQYPKRGQQFNMNDFKLYEDRAIAVQKTWK